MNRIYANIKLPIDVFPNGQFKMLFDQMKIEVEMPPQNGGDIHEKIMEMREEMVENIVDHSNIPSMKEEEEEEEEEEEKEEEEEEEEEKEEKEEEEEEEEKKEIKIYKKDYPFNRIKKRINTTFRKWSEKNSITRKKYIPIDTPSSTEEIPTF